MNGIIINFCINNKEVVTFHLEIEVNIVGVLSSINKFLHTCVSCKEYIFPTIDFLHKNCYVQEVADIHMMNGEVEQWAGPVVDDSNEAKQVDLFLESEHAAMQKAFEEDQVGTGGSVSPPPQVEVRI